METKRVKRRLLWARRKALPAPEPSLPSLDLMLQIIMLERDKQLAHFDGLDAKAGVLLAFDGVLIVVSHGIRLAFVLPGIILASASAGFALMAFWPRDYPVLDPVGLRKYLTYETEATRLKLHDAIAEMVKRGSRVLDAKARSLKLALVLLLAAALTFGAGIIVSTNAPHAGRTHHGRQGQIRPRNSPSPSPSTSLRSSATSPA
jgi:hypothetical protein